MTDIVQFHRDGGLLDIVLTDPDGGNLISNAEGDRIYHNIVRAIRMAAATIRDQTAQEHTA